METRNIYKYLHACLLTQRSSPLVAAKTQLIQPFTHLVCATRRWLLGCWLWCLSRPCSKQAGRTACWRTTTCSRVWAYEASTHTKDVSHPPPQHNPTLLPSLLTHTSMTRGKPMLQANLFPTVAACILVGGGELLAAPLDRARPLGVHRSIVGRIAGPRAAMSLPCCVGVLTRLHPNRFGTQWAQDGFRLRCRHCSAVVLRSLTMLKAKRVLAMLTIEGEEVELSTIKDMAMLS